MQFPFIGGAYQGRSQKINPQECINLYPVSDIADAKNVVALYGTPGLESYVDMPTLESQVPGRVREMHYFHKTGGLYALIEEELYYMTAPTASGVTGLGNLGTLSNLVSNGDMELDANWNDHNSPTTNERSSTQAHAGTYSRKFVSTVVAGSGIKSDTFSTTTGVTYTVEAWVYPDDTTNVSVFYRRGDDSGSEVELQFDLTQDAWNFISFDYVESAGGANAYVGFGLIIATDAGSTWYVDDVRVFAHTDASVFAYMASNTDYFVVVEPGSGGWYHQPAGSLTAISDGDFPTPRGLCFVDGYFIVTEQNSAKWFISAIDDPTSWDALDYNTARTASVLLACMALRGQVALLGRDIIEFHAHTGTSDFPFDRVATVEEGLGAEGSLDKHNDSLIFLSAKREIIAITDYQVRKLSTDSIDYHIQGYDTVEDARGFVYTQEGHTFYQISFPGAGKTWVYDLTMGLWHERQSYANGEYGRHLADCFAMFGEIPLVGDHFNGLIYKLDMDTYTENGTDIRRRRTTPVLHSSQKNLFYHSLEIDVDLQSYAETMENIGSDTFSDYGTPVTAEISDENPHDGLLSLKIEIDGADEGAKSTVYTSVTGASYKLTCWVYPDDNTELDLVIRKGDDSGDLATETWDGLTQDAWNFVEYEWTETAGGASAYFAFSGGDETSGVWYCDTMKLYTYGGGTTITLDWSNDSGETFGNTHDRVIYTPTTRARWLRLGMARDRVFRVTITDSCRVALINAELEATVGNK